MKAFVFGDLQAGESTERCRHDPTLPLQRWRVQRFYAEAARLARARGCQAVFDLGDTTDDRNSLPLPTLAAVAQGTRELAQGTQLARNLKLIGNHEQHVKHAGLHTGALFSPWGQVVEGVETFTWPDLDLTIVAASFPADGDAIGPRVEQALRSARTSRTLLLGHLQVKGAQMGGGLSAGGIEPRVVNLATAALLGHVHRWQALGSAAWYLGSPFQQDYGEAGSDKKVAILDLETLAVEFVELPGFPRYRHCNLPELPAQVEGEDRWRVSLRTHAEATEFYAQHRVDAVPELMFNADPSLGSAEAGETRPNLDPSALVREFARLRPLTGWDFTVDEVADYGVRLLTGQLT